MLQRVRGVEGDGLLEEVFHLLWHKTGTSSTQGDTSDRVRIPDTVVVKYGQAVAWYFTSIDGTIKRKAKVNLSFDKIEEQFLARPSRSGLVASYIYNEKQSGLTKCVVEHLDASGLSCLLSARASPGLRRPDGILQKWLDPQGERNASIRALWSPKITIAEKIVNTRNLFDRKLGVNDRAATFEDERTCQAEPIKGERIIGQVETLATTVVDHIFRLTHGKVKINRLALTLKQASDGNLWLQFVTASRVHDPTPLELRCEFSLAKNSDCPFVCAVCNARVRVLVTARDLCDDCFLAGDAAPAAAAPTAVAAHAPFVRGTQPLEPHRLRLRRQATAARLAAPVVPLSGTGAAEAADPPARMRSLRPTGAAGTTADGGGTRKRLETLLARYRAAGKLDAPPAADAAGELAAAASLSAESRLVAAYW